MVKRSKKKIEDALYYMHNDTEKAIEIFDEILEKEPENIKAINGKGFSLMKMNQPEEAEKYFDFSLTINETPAALINKGIISKNNEKYDQSLIYYDRAIQIKPNLNGIVSILKDEILELTDRETEQD